MKFKVGQVVAVKQGNCLYHWISGILKDLDGNEIYFVDGDNAIKSPDGNFANPFFGVDDLRCLTSREAGR